MKKTLLCSAVAISLASTILHADIFGPSEKEIGEIAADYLVKNPEILIKVSNALKTQEIEKTNAAMIDTALKYQDKLLDKKTPYVGNANGKVAIVQFFDYQCGFCQKLAPVMSALQTSNPEIKLLMKETPIFAQRSEVSGYAAQMGLKVFSQGGSGAYAKYHKAVLEQASSGSKVTTIAIDKLVEASGIEISSLQKKENKAVIDNLKLFSELGFQGTPALVIMPVENPTAENTSIIRGFDVKGIKAALLKASKTTEISTSSV